MGRGLTLKSGPEQFGSGSLGSGSSLSSQWVASLDKLPQLFAPQRKQSGRPGREGAVPGTTVLLQGHLPRSPADGLPRHPPQPPPAVIGCLRAWKACSAGPGEGEGQTSPTPYPQRKSGFGNLGQGSGVGRGALKRRFRGGQSPNWVRGRKRGHTSGEKRVSHFQKLKGPLHLESERRAPSN